METNKLITSHICELKTAYQELTRGESEEIEGYLARKTKMLSQIVKVERLLLKEVAAVEEDSEGGIDNSSVRSIMRNLGVDMGTKAQIR